MPHNTQMNQRHGPILVGNLDLGCERNELDANSKTSKRAIILRSLCPSHHFDGHINIKNLWENVINFSTCIAHGLN